MACCLILLLILSSSTTAATFTVDSLLDNSDDVPGDGQCESLVGSLGDFQLVCTLRGAIEESNALTGADTIEFSVAGTFRPVTPLPPITERLSINGDTAPGAPPFTSAEPQPPVLVIDGSFYASAGRSHGLAITTRGFLSSITNLAIVNVFGPGILIEGTASKVYGCWSGVLPDGTVAGNSEGIRGNADDLVIGNPSGAGSGNVLSGNLQWGFRGNTSGSVFGGNRIGVDAAGLVAIPNAIGPTAYGVEIQGNDNVFDGPQNIIAGNASTNLYFDGDDNQIRGSLIGVGLGEALVNGGDGIRIDGDRNIVGGMDSSAGNEIGGNRTGVDVRSMSATRLSGNVIANNQITENSMSGIGINIAEDTQIDSNFIVSNDFGIFGVNQTGTQIINNIVSNNSDDGLYLQTQRQGLVDNNDIGGNGGHGITLASFSQENLLSNNRIGQPVYNGGAVADPNDGDGIHIEYGDTPGDGSNVIEKNVIANNGQSGVSVIRSNGNEIFDNQMFANQALGIDLDGDGRTDNDVGDADEGGNQLQNYPGVVATDFTGTILRVQANMANSLTTSSAYPITVRFYLGENASPEQGRQRVGPDVIISDPSLSESTDILFMDETPGGFLVATATDADGNTSEFSPSIIFGTPQLPDELFANGFE